MFLKSKQSFFIVLFLVFLIAGVLVAVTWWKNRSAWPEGLIQANGRIEGDLISVATKFMGRINKLVVREGDTVTTGQVMVQLDDVQVRAQVKQAQEGWKALEARVQATHEELAVLNLQVPLAIESAEAKVREIKAKLQQALAVEREARRELDRMRILFEKGNVSLQEFDVKQRQWDVVSQDILAMRSLLVQTQKDLAQAELGWRRIRAKEAEVAGLERQRDQAEGALEEVESVLADLTIRAPSNGTITTRMVDIGEVVSAGAPLFEMVDLDHLYLQVYVPEVQIGKVRLGLLSQVFIDAFPDRPFPAVVRYIASRAEFTPKEVQTPDERVKLTYAVKLYFEENPDHRLTPGMPADAVIRWKDDIPWRKPQW
ncbi:MAG: efflux RND transporter periplasmic adaptor subunit [Nitrospirales bacterium]|nr:efflux RND transporter periplasmic adaptor subunit [Nitrospirales bacterium]